jgi:hypothetical protein
MTTRRYTWGLGAKDSEEVRGDHRSPIPLPDEESRISARLGQRLRVPVPASVRFVASGFSQG